FQLCSKSLKDWIDETKNTPRDPHTIKMIFKQILEAVEFIHEKQAIHRDLKPSNILMDNYDSLRVSDMGNTTDFMKDDEKNDTRNRTSIETKFYSAPEQGEGRYSFKADMFSLGLIFELATQLDKKVREKAFLKFRQGESNDELLATIKDGKTRDLINRLTSFDSQSRPTCRDVLNTYY
ncbi:hypothetical protein PFISCL1PPCAC_7510, partial [Pristionchus fissidentatus]